MMDFCFLLSFLILLVSGIGCGAWNLTIHVKKLSKSVVINPINLFSVFAFVAFLILFIPNAFKEYESNIVLTLISALFDTVDSLSFGNRIGDMLNRFFDNFDGVSPLYVLYACAVTLLIPVLTTRTVFLVFRDWFTQLRYTFNFRNSFHIFSELNNKSIIIAKDITEKDKNARVIFSSINKKTTDSLYIEQARKINALLTNKTLNGFRVNTAVSNKKLHLYFIGEDKNKNIKMALDRFESIKDSSRKITVFVFSTDPAAEQVVDLANSRNGNPEIKMELFNQAQRTAYNLVYEHPVYGVESDGARVNVMILGSGHMGHELTKAIAWCSQMVNQKFSIKVFDGEKKNERIGSGFNRLSEKLDNIGTKLNLEFFDYGIFSEDFDENRFERADYITIDLGDDSSNLAAALQMRELYARRKSGTAYFPAAQPSPKIITIIENEETKKIVEALNDPAIIPYGALCDVFNTDNIIDWKTDKAGEFLHACYYGFKYKKENPQEDVDSLQLLEKGIEDYSAQSEVNKRSSRAAAIHGKYKFRDIDVDPDGDRLFSAETDELLRLNNESLLRCEHDRWNVFQMLDGWEPWNKNNLSKDVHKDNYAKIHAYLAKFDELKTVAQKIYGNGTNPVEYDQVIVCSMRYAYEYAENGKISKEKADQLFETLREYLEEARNERVLSESH